MSEQKDELIGGMKERLRPWYNKWKKTLGKATILGLLMFGGGVAAQGQDYSAHEKAYKEYLELCWGKDAGAAADIALKDAKAGRRDITDPVTGVKFRSSGWFSPGTSKNVKEEARDEYAAQCLLNLMKGEEGKYGWSALDINQTGTIYKIGTKNVDASGIRGNFTPKATGSTQQQTGPVRTQKQQEDIDWMHEYVSYSFEEEKDILRNMFGAIGSPYVREFKNLEYQDNEEYIKIIENRDLKEQEKEKLLENRFNAYLIKLDALKRKHANDPYIKAEDRLTAIMEEAYIKIENGEMSMNDVKAYVERADWRTSSNYGTKPNYSALQSGTPEKEEQYILFVRSELNNQLKNQRSKNSRQIDSSPFLGR